MSIYIGRDCKLVRERRGEWHRVERSCRKFRRRFRLPANAKADETKGSMENGESRLCIRDVSAFKMFDVYVSFVGI